jgi:general secretion pathway protein G
MRRSERAGMGAVQLLATLVVMLVAAFGFYYYVNSRAETGKRVVTVKRLTLLEEALAEYAVDCAGALPTARQGLGALLRKPETGHCPQGWHGPYLQDPETVRDGWGRPFIYLCPGRPMASGSSIMRPYDLASYGRDGRESGKGLDRDICDWDRSTLLP